MRLKKFISSSLAIGLLLNSTPVSFAGILSEDGRYEAFEGNNITINNILEEDKVDVEVEGNTLVNLILDGKALKLNKLENAPNSSYYYLKVNLRYPLKANTTYTISFNVASNPYNHIPLSSIVLGQGDKDEGYNLDTWSYRLHWDKHFNMKPDEPGLGRYSATFTTPSRIEETSFNWIKIIGEKVSGQPYDTTIEDLMLVEGEYELDDYFDGVKSVGQNNENGNSIEVVSNNKNLFNSREVYEAGYSMGVPYIKPIKANEENGTFIRVTEKNYWNVGIGFHIKTEKNSDYTLTVNSFSNDGVDMELRAIGVYRHEFPFKDKPNIDNYLDRLIERELNETNNTLTYNSKDYDYILFYIGGGWNPNANEVKTLSISQIEVQKSSLKSESYTLPLSNTLQIPLKEPLRGLPNGVKDRIIKRNGQWIIERNLAQYTITGNENWLNDSTTENNLYNTYRMMLHFPTLKSGRANIISDKFSFKTDYTVTKDSSEGIFGSFNGSTLYIDISKEKIDNISGSNINEKFKTWLSQNPVTIVYELLDIYAEPVNANLSFNLYEDTTHISNSSNLPANMKVTIDRTMNRAVEAIELSKTNPTVSNISEARYWANLLKESIKKDELQGEISSITDIEDLQLEKKTVTANIDMYIKSENALSMSLSTNSVTFNGYSGVDNIELNNAVNISISSSLPYQLNSYLLTEIENSDKSSRVEKSLLNIKSSSDIDYKAFAGINNKLILEDSCDAGNNKSHSVDLKLKGGQAYKADVYKTVIKFEAEQK